MGATYLIVALLPIVARSYLQCSNAVRGTLAVCWHPSGLFLGLSTDLVVAGSDGVSHRRREYPRSAGTGDEGPAREEGD
jgi:hypothetical protein